MTDRESEGPEPHPLDPYADYLRSAEPARPPGWRAEVARVHP